MLKYSCLIVEDEPLSAEILTDYIRQVPFLELRSVCADAIYAMEMLQKEKIDLLFLDIQMPELTGIQFMKIIRNRCKVILTTAYTQYALEGYEHDVVDYLLKPITLDRFMIAVQKVKISPAPPPDHLFIKTEYRIQRVDLAAILYIEALRDYVAIHTETGKILSLESMKHMEELLPADDFIRNRTRRFFVAREVH